MFQAHHSEMYTIYGILYTLYGSDCRFFTLYSLVNEEITGRVIHRTFAAVIALSTRYLDR